jgi:hypothetical protein
VPATLFTIPLPQKYENLPIRGGKFELDLSMVFPCERKELLAMNVWLSRDREFLVDFCIPDRLNSHHRGNVFAFEIPNSHFLFTKFDTQRTRAPWATSVLTANFSAATGDFPCGEKLIAPGMQRIEYAVIHKTRRSKKEL